MNLPGLLVEYLISGAYALIWIFILAVGLNPEILALANNGNLLPKNWILVLLPFCYVLGMFTDLIGKTILTPLKNLIHKRELKDMKPRMSTSEMYYDSEALGNNTK